MPYSSIIVPKVAEGFVSHQTNLGVASYDLNELYSPDTELWKSKVLDLGSPKYPPQAAASPTRYWFDRSRYRNHGTITGATWQQQPSGVWALHFDGDDRVTVPLAFTGTALTILVWVKMGTDITTLQGIVGSDTGAGSGIWINSGSIYPFHAANGFTAGVVPSANTFVFLAATFANLPTLPALGISLNGGTFVTGTSTNSSAFGNIRIGVRNGVNFSPLLNNDVGEVTYYNQILTLSQVKQRYLQTKHLFGV